MGISKTKKEKTVIIFFALALVVIVGMAVINPQPPKDEHDDCDDSAPSASLDEKIAQANERLKAAPKNINALIYLGDLYMDAKKSKEAMGVFNEVMKLEPQNIHALSDLGLLYQQTGFYAKSFETFETVISIEPDNLSALYYLGMISRYSRKNNKEALKYFEKLLSLNSDPSLSEAINKEIKDIKSETQ